MGQPKLCKWVFCIDDGPSVSVHVALSSSKSSLTDCPRTDTSRDLVHDASLEQVNPSLSASASFCLSPGAAGQKHADLLQPADLSRQDSGKVTRPNYFFASPLEMSLNVSCTGLWSL